MSGGRYVSFKLEQFQAHMSEMGFTEIAVPKTKEYVFERKMHEDRFSVRIFSSIDWSGWSRDSGKDAIRVMLYDHKLGKPSYCKTVKRTRNAFSMMRQRARDAWAWKNDHKCSCGAVMAERGDFFACTDPKCRNRKPIR